MNAPSIQSSAMLLDVSISLYTGRRTDRKSAAELATSKGADKAATSVQKHLFAGDTDLAAIQTHASACRQRVYLLTMPWADQGTRLLPTKMFFDATKELADMKFEFERLVGVFVNSYTHKISNAAFKMGQLFDRTEYPSVDEIASKFKFHYAFSPVPDAGDFRVDIPAEALAMVQESYSAVASDRIQQAVGDAWTRLYDMVASIHGKVTDPEDGGRRTRLHEATLTNALELCELLKGLNVFDDPLMNEMRLELYNSIKNVDIGTLRESPEVRSAVKNSMQSLLDKFS